MRNWLGGTIFLILSACSPSNEPVPDTPPPIPDGAETVEFERETRATTAPDQSTKEPAPTQRANGSTYWGVEAGEPLPLMWEDLMPEGSEEALMKEYQEFYEMLEKRYAANATTLADADPYAAIEEGSEFDFMPQLGTFDTVSELNGQFVRIPGYVVPFDFATDARHSEFLFVPYMGACIHTPPPPPNQIIFIRADPAVRIQDIWAPYWIEGTLATEKNENDLGDAAYSLSMASLEPYPVP